jgi:hypothetical protein
MKAKLIKSTVQYRLLNEDGIVIATSFYGDKLSFKNCQAIERCYDLDELSKDIFPDSIIFNDFWVDGKYESEEFNLMPYQLGFKVGFQKALESVGDKKFSEEDMKSFAQNYYREIRENKSNLLWSQLADKCLEEHIQSLQQNEWDVEIETIKEEYVWTPPGEGFEDQTYRDYRVVYKLDEEGCLILKRI